MIKIEIELDVNNSMQKTDEGIEKLQQNFLETTFGKVINSAIDIGLKAVLPDLIENQIIGIKDVILESGFSEGIKEVINSGIDIGKSAIGIVTGEFENISQIELAVKNGGILDQVSDLLDHSINIANKKNIIDNSTSSIIRKGKNTIISSISNKIEETLTNQIKAVEKIEKFTKNWKDAYGNKDFSKMENAYKNIQNYIEKVVPLEKIINDARTIENIHELIKNSGKDFNLSEESILLAQKLG